MGMSRITIEVVGNHGCQREAAAEGPIEKCSDPHCLDCKARDYVAGLKSAGGHVEKATIEHWPTSTPVGPVDDLLTRTRDRKF